jgi:hypothetical protein
MMSGGGREGGGEGGQKVLSRPSADSFAVGRSQKEVFSCVDIEAIEVAGTGIGHKRHK